MEQKVYKKSYPTTVLKLYIRLYCKKRNAPKNKMMEAIQSWVTLNENEREQFINKYKECEINYKKKMANYLSKAQPFLKKKYLKRNRAVSDLTVNKKLYNEQINTEKIVIDEEVPVPCTLEREVENLSSLDNMDEVGITHCDLNVTPQSPPRTDSFTNSNQTSNDILAEPVPPSTLYAKDLFKMIKSRNKHSTETWESLTSTQKSRYQKALSLLKDDYIVKFKSFLESLPSRQLFNYYNNYFS